MSSSTCDTTTCVPCSELDNCGCLNPSTFGCTTYANALALDNIDVDAASGEDGDSILEKIDAAIGLLQDNEGKVKIDGDDTCPEYLFDKLEEGLNISFTQTGTGCDRKIVINAVEGGVPIDINVKASAADTTTGYLYDKIDGGTYLTKSILTPGANEKVRLQLVPSTLISADAGNQLILGGDGKLKTSTTAADGSETKIIEGAGVTVDGSGTLADPYVIATNPSIQVVRPCFDGIWRNITIVATGNPNVIFVSGAPQYRYRFDGTIEFKGSLTYNVAFGAYSTGDRKYTVTVGNIPTTCLNGTEQAGVADLKGINYIDIPQASADQITQQYGYIIRKSSNNIILEFQSSFTAATPKTVVVNFDGAVSHPSI